MSHFYLKLTVCFFFISIKIKPEINFILGTVKIIYEVISIDGWSRERSEGYAVYTIPFLAGRFIEKVDCYRDLGDDTWLNWLERYFIGGRRKLQITDFNGIITDNTNTSTTTITGGRNSLNRYGNHTQSTGQLTICRNVIVQRNVDEIDASDFERGKSGSGGSSSMHRQSQRLPTISNILLAYHRAREKLESITNANEI